MEKIEVRLVLKLDTGTRFGIGKATLLKAMSKPAISGAGRTMGMSFKRAWQLIDSMNKSFESPIGELHSETAASIAFLRSGEGGSIFKKFGWIAP